MIKLDVLRDNPDKDAFPRTFTVPVWFDAEEISSVQADPNPRQKATRSLVSFKPSTNRRAMIVEGEAEAIATAIGAEQDRQRRPMRRIRGARR